MSLGGTAEILEEVVELETEGIYIIKLGVAVLGFSIVGLVGDALSLAKPKGQRHHVAFRYGWSALNLGRIHCRIPLLLIGSLLAFLGRTGRVAAI